MVIKKIAIHSTLHGKVLGLSRQCLCTTAIFCLYSEKKEEQSDKSQDNAIAKEDDVKATDSPSTESAAKSEEEDKSKSNVSVDDKDNKGTKNKSEARHAESRYSEVPMDHMVCHVCNKRMWDGSVSFRIIVTLKLIDISDSFINYMFVFLLQCSRLRIICEEEPINSWWKSWTSRTSWKWISWDMNFEWPRRGANWAWQTPNVVAKRYNITQLFK